MFFPKNRLFDIRLQIGTHVLIHQIICFLSWLDRFNKMLPFFCFSKLEAPLFRFFFSRSETSISGENPCFPISGGHVHPPTTKILIFTKIIFFDFLQKIMIVKIHVLVVGGCTWPPEIGKHGFSPEMDVSGRDKKKLKSGAPNFEKQKNESIFKFGENSLFFQDFPTEMLPHDQNQWAVVHIINCVPF